jgi:hypothetical protein
MTTEDRRFEEWVFLGYASGDLHHARLRVEEAAAHTDRSVQFALIEVAVLNYARPFSGNRGKFGHDGRQLTATEKPKSQDHYRLPKTMVPQGRDAMHEELMGLRHRLFAHTDIAYQDAHVMEVTRPDGERAYLTTVRTADYFSRLARSADIISLIDDVNGNVEARRAAIAKEDWFQIAKATRLQQRLPFGGFRQVAPGQFQSELVIDLRGLHRPPPPTPPAP